jgi:hypothetical protein
VIPTTRRPVAALRRQLVASFAAYWALLGGLFIVLDVMALAGWPVWLLGGLWMLAALHMTATMFQATQAAGWRLPWAWGAATLIFAPLVPLVLPPALWWVLRPRA